ncbi:LLM class flavin-dependent oxidoreductase [Zavarzinia compransoris]|uniref:Alkanesulfonate monooxygenase n=1 Tax=Zavarzinia compransoris TaxID=1264899 RepID=A0A317DV35_9PROT|nr:LLM class flavin-dependent oxidoreductase [Zavarzinia compransoris]PWR18272.1 alkanesulfonate monooxygenase [Zavarzinia compransoris]TDP43672.1 alkanesulfonate monooxygenase [Zavarzinia compransoris]
MATEFIGLIATREVSEIHPPRGPQVDPDFIGRIARAHEDAGFDRVLIGYASTAPDGGLTVAHAAREVTRLHFLLAHRPGVIAPTLAARQLATLDQLTGGRLAVHIIAGGDDREQRRDGDYLDHAARYDRADEYIGILRRAWTEGGAFGHAGTHYRFEDYNPAVKPVQKPHLPVYFGGASDAAIAVAARHADVYALWGETKAQVADTIARVRAAAARQGRHIRFSLSLRPILAATEAAAWERAERIRATTRRLREAAGLPVAGHAPANVGSQRLLAAAGAGDRLDTRLWTGVAALTGAQGNSTALVGTAAQVAEALAEYRELGVDIFLIRGFDPLADAIDYGRELIPLTRHLIAERERLSKAG